MKNVMIFIILTLFLFSCKKECNSNNPKNLLKGKIRTLTEFDEDNAIKDTITYNFIYDSIDGDLKKIRVRYVNIYFSSDTAGLDEWNIENINDSTILFKGEYKVITSNKQILRIYKYDSVTQQILYESTSVTLTNENLINVKDIGLSPVANNISYNNFQFSNYNCISYSSTWIENLSGFPINKFNLCSISFSTINNTNELLYQNPISERGYLNTQNNYLFISYFLGINGYYIVKPNKNLIYSFTDSSLNNKYTIKYSYIEKLGKIIKQNIIDSASGFVYGHHEMTYY